MTDLNENVMLPNGGYAVKAIYTDQVLSEYKANPLIEALPSIFSEAEFVRDVAVYPPFDKSERELDSKYRFHCVERLSWYFQPLNRHIDLEQRLSRIIRQGYLARNPLGPEYAARLRQIHKAIQQGGGKYQLANHVSVLTSASGFTVIGISGGGKSTAIKHILSTYPQVILHSNYKGLDLNLYQVVWLKLDCPHAGSLKGLCIDFFLAIDKLLGTNNYSKFGSPRNSEDAMLAQMAQIASTHCLGVLIIDEIQNLSRAKSGGSENMLSFFVKLVNTIGVPVLRIGTNKALPVLQGDFRQARRGVGEGGMIWERMENDEEWNFFIEGMFEYQWTKRYIPVEERTAEIFQSIKDVLYEESQGIVDIAVKLYMMAQWRAMALGTEIITSELINQVAKDSLHLVRPMLDALKSGDPERIARYGDIRPIDTADFYQKYLSQLEAKERTRQTRIVRRQQGSTNISATLKQVILGLVQLDIEPAMAKHCAERALAARTGEPDVTLLVKEAYKFVLQDGQSQEAERVVDVTTRTDRKRTRTKVDLQPDDLRSIVAQGQQNQLSGYEVLKARGFIKSPFQDILNLG